jgi:hypothetical protein
MRYLGKDLAAVAVRPVGFGNIRMTKRQIWFKAKANDDDDNDLSEPLKTTIWSVVLLIPSSAVLRCPMLCLDRCVSMDGTLSDQMILQ